MIKLFTQEIDNLECVELYKQKLKATLQKILEYANDIQPIEIFLFGSVARGTYTSQSDLDVCIVTEKDSHVVSTLLEFYDIRDDIGYPKVDIIVRNPIDLSDSQFAINRFLSRDKIIIWRKEK